MAQGSYGNLNLNISGMPGNLSAANMGQAMSHLNSQMAANMAPINMNAAMSRVAASGFQQLPGQNQFNQNLPNNASFAPGGMHHP